MEGGVFHVFARGNDKRLIYRDDLDRRTYLRMLRGTVLYRRWRLLSYCLMENHLHLLVETPEANLAVGMQRMHSLYAREFNRRHRRSGHVFQGGYGAVRIKSDEQLWTVAVYIAMNPVEAGLCGRAEEWRWSSHSAAMAGEASGWVDVQHLLAYFGAAGGAGRRRYAEMFETSGTSGAAAPASRAPAPAGPRTGSAGALSPPGGGGAGRSGGSRAGRRFG
jgi:putative transposase